jgi:hypothetical protein
VVGHVTIVSRLAMGVRACSSSDKIGMSNAVPVQLIVCVFMLKEWMKVKRGQKKRNPRKDYQRARAEKFKMKSRHFPYKGFIAQPGKLVHSRVYSNLPRA